MAALAYRTQRKPASASAPPPRPDRRRRLVCGRKKTALRRSSASGDCRTPIRVAVVSATRTGYCAPPRSANRGSDEPAEAVQRGRLLAPSPRQSHFDGTSCRGLRIEHENRVFEEFDCALGARRNTLGIAFEHRRSRRDPASRLASTFVNAAPERLGEPLALERQLTFVESCVGLLLRSACRCARASCGVCHCASLCFTRAASHASMSHSSQPTARTPSEIDRGNVPA